MSARTLRRLAALLLFASAAPALAVDIQVDAVVGSDANDGLTWATAKATVGAGLALAVTLPGPDAVRVAEGRYLGQVVMPPETSLIGGYASGGLVRDVLRRPTILDGAGAGPVVSFGPGTDASMLDGFVVTGGRTSDPTQGGGITIRQSNGTVSRCIVERNAGCAGAGIHLRQASRPMVVDTLVRQNIVLCDSSAVEGGAVAAWQSGDDSSMVRVFRDLVISENVTLAAGMSCGGLVVSSGQAILGEGVLISANGGAGFLNDNSVFWCDNCAVTGQMETAFLRTCRASVMNTYFMTAFTAQGNRRGGLARDPASGNSDGALAFYLEHAAVGREQTFPTQAELDIGCDSAGNFACMAVESIAPFATTGICFGFQVGDPAFVAGPGGNIYLSHVATGQPADSPAIDAGSQPASDFGLDLRTTRTDHVPDSGALDWGYHFPVSPTLWTATDFRVLRGSDPRVLPVHVTGIASLPWTDAPGVLSDPALPLLFYSVEWPLNRILVTKDVATGSVRLAF